MITATFVLYYAPATSLTSNKKCQINLHLSLPVISCPAQWQFVPTYTFYTVTLVAISMSHLFLSKSYFISRRFSHTTDQRWFCSFWKGRQSTNINCTIFHFFAAKLRCRKVSKLNKISFGCLLMRVFISVGCNKFAILPHFPFSGRARDLEFLPNTLVGKTAFNWISPLNTIYQQNITHQSLQNF